MCAYSKEKEGGFFLSFVSGDSTTRDFAPHGFVSWSCKPLFGRGAMHVPSPSYQSQQHHSHQGTVLGRSCRMKTPKPFLQASKQESSEVTNKPLWPQWAKLKDQRMNCLNDRVFLTSSAQASPNCPVHETTTEILVLRCGWGILKERDEICPSMNVLGHGWRAARCSTDQGPWDVTSESLGGGNNKRTSDMATCITSVNNQHFYCIWECYNVSN